MPYHDPDPTDPMTLGAVAFEADPETERETLRTMAACFAEEFARMEFRFERILFLFQSPVYRGPHRAYRALGEDEVRRIIEAAVRARRPAAGPRSEEIP